MHKLGRRKIAQEEAEGVPAQMGAREKAGAAEPEQGIDNEQTVVVQNGGFGRGFRPESAGMRERESRLE
jgi:hypothetical protein